jgi:hypothetical protein
MTMEESRSSSSAIMAGAAGNNGAATIAMADEGSASAGSRKEGGIDSMFGNLEIGDDEFDDFVLEEEEIDLSERALM